jgi:diguanylate cyclase (GGDEF)-like protein
VQSTETRATGRSLITEVLGAQLAITGAIGLIALVGLAWTSQVVIDNNLRHWATQWALELNELGAPFYVSERQDAVLGVERFVAKYPEIDRVTWYQPDGTALFALGRSGTIEVGNAPLDAATMAALVAKAGEDPPYLLTEDSTTPRHFRIAGPVWTESLAGDGLFSFDPATARTTMDLRGFVSVELDFATYRSAFVPRLATASAVLIALLIVAWLGGRAFLKRALAPLSALEQPLARLAAGDANVTFPSSRHRELRSITTALDDTMQSLQKREQHLVHLANHDSLTGLYNRHRLIAELDAEIVECSVRGRHSALLFVDLDQFKYVNDTCGHSAGDQLLKLAARHIRHGVGGEDLVARFGGDEFVVLLKDVTRAQAKTVAARILEEMRAVKHVERDEIFHLQCSIGIAMLGSGRFDAQELLAQADIACQAAKARGRNRVEFYSIAGKQSERMRKDVHWTRTIRDALVNDSFALHYQPLLHIKSGEVDHYEALLRLETDRGPIGAQVFLPVASRFGLMADIDAWVVARAIRTLAGLQTERPGLRFSVNLSSFAFEDEGLAGRVRALLKEHGVAGDRLVFEITEQLAVRFAGATDKQIALLRDLGCRFAVDDFGTGYSSFSYLKRLPVDYLKIDGSFIKGLARDHVDQSMVRMVAEVGRAAGMETVAEYVQNAATLVLLGKYGIDYAQGYYIGRPTPVPQPVALDTALLASRR